MVKVIQWLVGMSLVLCVCTVGIAKEQKWDTTARKVLQLAEEMDDRSESSLRYANEDKQALEARLAKAQSALSQMEQKRASAEETLNTLSKNRAELAAKYEKDMADMKTVEGAVRTALRHSIERGDLSPLSSFYPERMKMMSSLLSSETFLGLGGIQKYSDMLFQDMVGTGGVEKKKINLVGIEGRIENVELYRAGGFFLGYLGKDGIFALPNGAQPAVSLVSQSSGYRNDIKKWIQNESDVLPIDITNGAALHALEQQRGIHEWVEAGGMLLYPILLAGFVGAVVALAKWIHLFGQRRLGGKVKEQIFVHLKDGQFGDAEKILKGVKRCPASRVLLGALNWSSQSIDVLDSALQEGYMKELSILERALSIIGVLASIAPLLGLLGTVTGMIETFQAITIFGTGDPRMMSTGISEALITTQAGLGIAIPLLLVHHFLKRRISFLVDDMEACGTAMAALLGRRYDSESC